MRIPLTTGTPRTNPCELENAFCDFGLTYLALLLNNAQVKQ